MKKRSIILGGIMLLAFMASAQTWQLVWSDEFTNGIGPDWVFETGTGYSGWGNNELQYYRQENASVQNGELVITAKKENFGGAAYTSARMKTQGIKSWKYGKFEARIKIPSFQGSWPAFWMLGENITSVSWPACGEIDVMEHVNTTTEIHGTMHWQDHNIQYANYGTGTHFNDPSGYHIYTVEWDDKYIKWFLDGVQYHIASIENGVNGTSEFHNEFFLLLNMAIGGNWPGFTIDDSALPAKMYVDYVRVYQDGIATSSQEVKKLNLETFPNPTTNDLFIVPDGNTEKESYQITNLIGEVVQKGIITSNKISTRTLTTGIYFLKLSNGMGAKFMKASE